MTVKVTQTLRAAALAGVAAIALAAGAAQAQTLPALTVGMDVDAGTFDPRLARDTTAFRAADLIYSGLV